MSIAGDAERRSMTITWNDGHVSELGYEWLRWHCPCATCAGEGGEAGVLASTQELTDSQRALEDLELVGSYGMAPSWQDGHHTGIFTFRNLRAMCPCATCTESRRGMAEQR